MVILVTFGSTAGFKSLYHTRSTTQQLVVGSADNEQAPTNVWMSMLFPLFTITVNTLAR